MIKQLALIAAVFATPALAETPWLVKSQNSGYVRQQDAQSVTCSIYSNRVEVVRYVGSGLSVKEVRPVALTGDFATEIRLAASETLSDEGTLCDAPGTRITAHLPTDTNNDGLLLFAVSSCYRDGRREGEHSSPLINLTNGLCGSL